MDEKELVKKAQQGYEDAFAALVVLIAAVASGLLVRRRLDRLDLIEVLKTKE